MGDKLVRTSVFLALLGIIAMASSCGSSNVRVGASEDGGQIELAQGQVLVIELESNPTTGYQWTVEEVDVSILKQLGDAQYERTGPAMPGAGGSETFRFEAVAAGETTLRLIYHRPWEEGVAPGQTFTLEVIVR